MPQDRYVIAQLSDIHAKDPRFDAGLMQRAIDRINDAEPDLVVCPGDLTVKGYRDEFEAAAHWLSQIACEHLIVVPGNHDERNVGWEIYEEMFHDRWYSEIVPFGLVFAGEVQEQALIVALDSAKPDLDDGEVGRGRYGWVAEQFERVMGPAFRIVVMHHHLVPVPGTGRERNIVWDAGDVLAALESNNVDLVLAGHKHVPYVWDINGMLISTSGTVSTYRTRGFTPPSWTLITIEPQTMTFEIIPTAGGPEVREVFERRQRPEVR